MTPRWVFIQTDIISMHLTCQESGMKSTFYHIKVQMQAVCLSLHEIINIHTT